MEIAEIIEITPHVLQNSYWNLVDDVKCSRVVTLENITYAKDMEIACCEATDSAFGLGL